VHPLPVGVIIAKEDVEAVIGVWSSDRIGQASGVVGMKVKRRVEARQSIVRADLEDPPPKQEGEAAAKAKKEGKNKK
jgi:flagella basal body P-ring formation protein FlgA